MAEYANTDAVPASGEYCCTLCGEVQEFERGDDFTLCDSCGDENAGWEEVRVESVEEGSPDDELGF